MNGDCKLYAATILSLDTQELIRKAVEEEREECEKVCRELLYDVPADAIRSRSTKEK